MSYKFSKKLLFLLPACVVTVAVNLTSMSDPKMRSYFPEGYRHWTHIKTMLIDSASPFFATAGGFHHIYANDRAVEGYLSGKFPSGSVLVFDQLSMVEGMKGAVAEGKRKWLDIMVRENGNDSTGGWKFLEFEGDNKEASQLFLPKERCFTCHMKKKETGYVFSTYRK